MDAPILYVALLLAGFFVFMHAVAPLTVLLFSRFPCQYLVEELDLARALADQGKGLSTLTQQLGEIGFSPVAAAELNMQSRTILFLYRSEADPCVASIATSRNAVSSVSAVEFCQMYEDGSSLSLTNSPFPSIFPSWPRRAIFRLPGMDSVRSLYARFSRIRENHRKDPALVIRAGAELVEVQRALNEEMQHLIEIGYVSRECSDSTRRFRLRSAYLASWRLQWPWKGLLLKRAHDAALAASQA